MHIYSEAKMKLDPAKKDGKCYLSTDPLVYIKIWQNI